MTKDNLKFNLPKNIKQIGSIDENFKIYMEDFVFSFLNQYSKEKRGEEVICVLIGESYTIDGNNVLFINGAIKGEETISENGILKLSDNSFDIVENEIEKFFKGKEIVGWYYSQPGFSDYVNDEYINYHSQVFKNPYQVFFLSDPLENICSFYKYKDGVFEDIKGFIVYYEKNESMNEYILSKKNIEIDPEKEKFKIKDERLMQIKRKKYKNIEEQRKLANIFGSLSAVLFLICFIMGAGLIQSDDRITELETKLLKLDESYRYILSQVKDDNVQSVFAEATTSKKDTTTIITNTTEKTTQPTTQPTTELTTQATTTTVNEYQKYKVKDGDSLELISKKFYGNRNKIKEIMEVNNITDANKIYSGMIIKLP